MDIHKSWEEESEKLIHPLCCPSMLVMLLPAAETAASVLAGAFAAWSLGLDGGRDWDGAGRGGKAAGPAAPLAADAVAALSIGLDGSRGETNDGEGNKGGGQLHGGI